MNLRNPSKRRQAGWGLFELLCFTVACCLVLPLAFWTSHHFPNHPAAVFFIVMLGLYPPLGFLFCILMHLFFRWDYKRRHKTRVTPEDSGKKDA